MEQFEHPPLPLELVGKDEMNFIEFPFTTLSRFRRVGQNTLKFSDSIVDDNNKITEREWTVTGSEEFGLPLAQDNDVWLALLVLGKENNFPGDGRLIILPENKEPLVEPVRAPI